MIEISLADGEPHPIAYQAQRWVGAYLSDPATLFRVREALASSALANNYCAEIMLTTLDRLLASKPVSDRYLLGLAWFLKGLDDV